MSDIRITKEEARRFLIEYQMIGGFNIKDAKGGIMEYFRRVRSIQFDPLYVAGYNHDLVLQARVDGYKSEMLKELMYLEFKLIDQWDKNMSICITEDWPYFSRFRNGYIKWCADNENTVGFIKNEIMKKGAVCSSDFTFNDKVRWHYGLTRLSRAALEGMHYAGMLVIHHKNKTRKYYDFAERHIPEEYFNIPHPNVTNDQYDDWFVLRRISSIGMLWNRPSDTWLGRGSFKAHERSNAFKRLMDRNEIIEIMVDGIKHPLFIRNSNMFLLEKVRQNQQIQPRVKILAPLDNMLWDRNLALELFDFEYQ